jgi:uroporphyrinogen III methyltransferase/synthase
VQGFLGRLHERGRDLRALGHVRLAAIGPATAAALRGYHLEPDLVPDDYCSEGLVSVLRPHVAGKRVLLARADRGRDVLPDQLRSIAEVCQVAVYSQVDVGEADPVIVNQLRNGEIDDVVLTSSNIARALARLLDDACQARLRTGQTRTISISPVTSATVRELGWKVAAEAIEYTMDGVLEALVSLSEPVPKCQTGMSSPPEK